VKQLILVLLTIFLCGCVGEKLELAPEHSSWDEAMADECVTVCQSHIGDKTQGPCLDIMVQGWACDIAHSPRLPVDDLTENQCHDLFVLTPAHFVEVDEECNVIRVV